jgi:hypothetical protein
MNNIEIQELMGDDQDYLNKDGYYKDNQGWEYSSDMYYITFKKFYKDFVSKMKQTKEDFYILSENYKLHSNYKFYMSNYYKKDYDYSFVESPVLRYLLFDEPYNNDNIKNDPCFPLLDIEIREIMKNLIMLLKTSKDLNLIYEINEKIEQIKKTDYIFTDKEKKETIIPLMIYKKDY